MNTAQLNTELSNELVTLKLIGNFSFEEIFAVASDPLIWEQHPAPDRYKGDIFRLFYEDALSSGMAFAIIENKNETVIGSTRYYDLNPDNQSVAIGYTFLARKYWGGRYNFSAKKLMLDNAFTNLEKVFLHIGPHNLRSQIATTRLGAIKVAEKEFNHLGEAKPNIEYLITKEVWEKREK